MAGRIPDIRLYWWHFPPYVISPSLSDTTPQNTSPFIFNMSGAFPYVLRRVLVSCGLITPDNQTTSSITVRQVNNSQDFQQSIFPSDVLELILPFSTDGDELFIQDDYRLPSEFVPLATCPGAVHFYKALEQPVGSDLVTVIFQGWPMLVFILLGAGYSGIIIWLLDRLWNPSNFPKPFIRGFWEGFWWAFVTMTTVGYGDTTPRSFQARMFGLIWIVVGITILSVFTATVTTVLTQESLGVHYTIPGNEVGVVNGTEDYKLVIKEGGMPAVATDFNGLLEAARTEKTHSVLYDQYGFVYEQHKLGNDFIVETIIKNPVLHGVLVVGSQSDTKTCLIAAFKQDRSTAFQKLVSFITPISRKIIRDNDSAQNLFQPKTILYLWYGLAFWVFLFVGFIMWEFLYWRPKHRRRKVMKRELNLEHGMPVLDNVSTVSDSDNVSCFPKRPRYFHGRSPLETSKKRDRPGPRDYINHRIHPLTAFQTTQDYIQERNSSEFNNRKKELIEVGNLDTLIRRQKQELDDLENEMTNFRTDWQNKLKDLKRQHREERRKLLQLMDHEDNIRNETKLKDGNLDRANKVSSRSPPLRNATKKGKRLNYDSVLPPDNLRRTTAGDASVL